jgi:hypothetical protein
MTAYDSLNYMVGSFKRKYFTGDGNRDIILSEGQNTFCVIYGNALAFTTFAQLDRFCFDFKLQTQYSSSFRQTSSTSVPLQTYVPPQSNVAIVGQDIDLNETYWVLKLALLVVMIVILN